MMCWSMKAGRVLAPMLLTVSAVLVPLSAASPLHAQVSPGPTGWEPRGLPALNYDSDEGFGYGVLLELYNYGDGGYSPYRFTIQPTVFLTTGGRRDFNLFFDAPHLLPEGWRIDALLRSERQFSIPYYGLGNFSLFGPRKKDMEGQYYYRFGGTRRRASVNIQRTLGDTPLRVLAGLGATRTKIDPLPKDAITTLLNEVIENAISGSIPETSPGGGGRITCGPASSGIHAIGRRALTVEPGRRCLSKRCRSFWGASPGMFGGRWWIGVTCPSATGSRSRTDASSRTCTVTRRFMT